VSPERTLHILGMAGSLRSGSYNRALLDAARMIAPAGMELSVFDLAPIPLYNYDIEQQGIPDSVRALKVAIRDADALLIATPEYNWSIPGVLKNAIDWASRPPDNPFAGKPVAVIGASTGSFGTVRAQLHLRQILMALGAIPMGQPTLYVARAREKFDANGRLQDDEIREHLHRVLVALREWTLRLQGRI